MVERGYELAFTFTEISILSVYMKPLGFDIKRRVQILFPNHINGNLIIYKFNVLGSFNIDNIEHQVDMPIYVDHMDLDIVSPGSLDEFDKFLNK